MDSSFKDLLSDAIKRGGMSRGLLAVEIVRLANGYLDMRLPGERREDARAISYKKGVLTIACKHSAVAHMIGREKNMVIQAVEKGLNECPDLRVQTKIVQNFPASEL